MKAYADKLFVESGESNSSGGWAGGPIPARLLWQGFNPAGFNKGIFVLLRGYIDESYGKAQNVFTFSCLMARGEDWDDIEQRWKREIDVKNKVLATVARPPISRYHASDCSGCRGEFSGWSRDERDDFVKKLFESFKLLPSHTVAIEMQLDELCEVFPEWASDRLKAAYHVLTQFVMNYIAKDLRNNAPGGYAKVTLFHDRTGSDGKYDSTILNAFNQMLSDGYGFDGKEYFTSITSFAWKDCTALQPADLVAYECFKQAEARLESRKERKSFTKLLNMSAFGIHSMTFTKEQMIEWRKRLTATTLG